MNAKSTDNKSPNGMDKFNASIEKFLFSSREKQAFLEDFATLINDGVPPARAAEVMSQLSKGGTKRLVDNIIVKISQGRAIADGMVGWLPQNIVELIRAGEQGGTLVQNLKSAAENLGRKNVVLASFASSMTYPLVVIAAGLAVLVYLNNSIFSQFADIKPVSEWPAEGQLVANLANFVQYWWWIVIIAIVLITFVMIRLLNDVVGEPRQKLDKVPGFAIYREITAARFMETLGMLIANGIVFKQSLKIMQHQANAYLSWHLMMMERRLAGGRANIAEVLDTQLVSDADVLRLRAIAEAKGFEHALVRLGRQAAERSVKRLTRVGKILGGVLLFFGAMLAITMVLGIYAVGSSLS